MNRELLYFFLAEGLGNTLPRPSVVSAGELQTLLDFATKEGVDCILARGMALNQKLFDSKDKLRVFAKAYGQSMKNVMHNQEKNAIAFELVDIWHKHGIRTLVLKGLSVAKLYPEIGFRYSSDMDCYLFGEQEKGNCLVEELGFVVDRSYYRNSSFMYKSLFVENHRYLTYVRGNRTGKNYERYLKSLLTETESIEGSYLETAIPEFNAIYVIGHMQGHFLSEGITLRHVCDWAVILKAYKSVLDWGQFIERCKEFGFLKFMYAITNIAGTCFGTVAPFDCPEMPQTDRLLDDIYTFEGTVLSGGFFQKRWNLMKLAFQSNWKYKYFSDKSMLQVMGQRIWGVLVDREPVV